MEEKFCARYEGGDERRVGTICSGNGKYVQQSSLLGSTLQPWEPPQFIYLPTVGASHLPPAKISIFRKVPWTQPRQPRRQLDGVNQRLSSRVRGLRSRSSRSIQIVVPFPPTILSAADAVVLSMWMHSSAWCFMMPACFIELIPPRMPTNFF